jgi:hypothetical protein
MRGGKTPIPGPASAVAPLHGTRLPMPCRALWCGETTGVHGSTCAQDLLKLIWPRSLVNSSESSPKE